MCPVVKCISNISKENKVLYFRLFLFVCYLYVGAYVFMTIEREPTEKQSEKIKVDMENLMRITTTQYNITDDQFIKLVNELKPLSCSNLPNWNYEHATSFTL
ncbi:hypothetical protein OS493_010798 [Desmophyllum pertusum]|uniref:Uncharacterized protein n=1 Tax=Desmophyllum pertusum TaxID=174260 RepID=A0A9W9ZFL3_9CNID|nr:hypothetical protein OS493_010798 [Desmophyllum pertusum]